MGQLISLTSIRKDDGSQFNAQWYFTETYFSTDRRSYIFEWPSKDYPICVAISRDDIKQSRNEIRKWILSTDVGTVIYEEMNKSYKVYYGTGRNWDNKSDIANYWDLFYFSESESALMFNLRFAHIVKPITDNHPTRHYGERC